ncbi:hypothetical protein ACFL0T_02865 [Candidatus Omnitrophota bacterium]
MPNQHIHLIYSGYGEKLFFEFGSFLDIRKVWHQKDGKFIKKNFLGYPIFFNPHEDNIKNIKCLEIFLKNHWETLKNGKKLHGDFTHFNILIDASQNITAIDQKDNRNNSIIADHFYFYSYLLSFLEGYYSSKKISSLNIKKQLDAVFLEIFKGEDKAFLLSLINNIDFTKFGNARTIAYVETFKNIFAEENVA